MYNTNSFTSNQPIQKMLYILWLNFNDKPEMWIVWQHKYDEKSPSGGGNHTSMLQLLAIKINKRNNYHTFRFMSLS